MSTVHTTKKPRLFYGWWVVAMASVLGLINVGGTGFTVSVFLDPMRDDVGWGSGVVFGSLAMRTMVGGLLAALAGPLAENRRAPRVMMPVGAVLISLSFIMVKWADSAFEFFFWYGVVGAAGTAIGSMVIMESLVVKWFVRRRAQAMMWFQVGPPVGPLLFPVMLTGLIAWLGWRDAWLWTGVGMLALLLPLTVFVRSRPEDMGLLPDGDTPEDGDLSIPQERTGTPQIEIEKPYSFTRSEALRTKVFWMLTIAMFVGMFGFPGYQAHWIPYFREVGFDAKTAAFGVFLFGAFSVTSRFIWGYFSTVLPIKPLFTFQIAISALGVILMLAVQNHATLVIWAVFQGMTMGVFFQLQAILVPAYFGREHIGAIRGIMWMPMTIAAGVAPLTLGWLHDLQGSYTSPFLLIMVFWLLAAALVFASKPPKRRNTVNR
jgi:MFS family permease